MLVSLVIHLKSRAHSLRLAFSTLLPLFFFTTFLFDSYTEAIMGYAIAHGVQYFIFMFFLASGSDGSSRSNVLALAIISILGWFLILVTRDNSWWGSLSSFIPGAALALIMWHFIVDSGLWRLRNKWQRDQVSKRFTSIP